MPGDPLLVHEVDDQLQLVQALEVGRLGLVAGVDQRLEAGGHQRGQAAAEHHLLAEEVGLGLLVEGGVEHAGPGGADGVRRRTAPGPAPCRWRPGAPRSATGPRRPRCRCGARGGPGPSGATMVTSTPGGGTIWPKRMLKPWANIRQSPSFRFGRHELVVGGLLLGVGQQDHDHVGLGGGVGQRQAPAARPPRPCAWSSTPSRRADPDVDAGLREVLGVGVPLGAVAQDGHLAAGDQARGRRRIRSTAWPCRVLFLLSVSRSSSSIVGLGRLSGVPA